MVSTLPCSLKRGVLRAERCTLSAFFLFHAPKCPFDLVLSHFSVCFGQNDARSAVFLSLLHHGALICMKTAHFRAPFLRRMHRIQKNAIICIQMGLTDAFFEKNVLLVHRRAKMDLKNFRRLESSGCRRASARSVRIFHYTSQARSWPLKMSFACRHAVRFPPAPS